MDNYHALLAAVAKHPTMIDWLDACDNRGDNLSHRPKYLPSRLETRTASPRGLGVA
jgi:uncharacterized protein (DUF1800 family)